MAKFNMDGGGESAGTATAQPSAAAPASTPEQQPSGPAPAQPAAATPEAPKVGDQDVYESAKAKLAKDRTYKLTPEEAEAVRNVQKGKPRPGTPKAEATPAAEAAKPQAPEVPAPFKTAMERLKVEKPEDLPGTIEKLQGELNRLNGERGNLGPLQERLQTSARTLEHQHAIIRDLAAGKPEAMEWVRKNAQTLGIDAAALKPAQAPQQAPAGEMTFDPANSLDPDLARFANQKISGLEGTVAELKQQIQQLSQNTEKYGKFYETELEKQGRQSAMDGAKTLIRGLLDTEGVSGLYDRRHGAIEPFLDKFLQNPAQVPEQIKHIVDVLRIANERKLDNLEDAYAIWERKNRGSRAVAAARSAPPEATPATVGLSDRQEGHGGRVQTGPTVEDVIAWTDRKKPIPAEFMKNGRFQRQLISPDVWAQVEARRGRK